MNPGYELTKSYQIKLDGLDQQGLNSLFDHLRFLKAFVLGMAAFAIVFRRQIFEVQSYNRLLLGTLFLCASGRAFVVAGGWKNLQCADRLHAHRIFLPYLHFLLFPHHPGARQTCAAMR